MERILFITETLFRETVDVSDSINSKSVQTAIAEAQDFYLSAVIGDKFLAELYLEVKNKTLTPVNKLLLNTYIQPVIIYQAAAILAAKANFKIGNLGIVKNEGTVDPKSVVDFYNQQTGMHLRRLTDYLSKHYSDYHQWLNGVDGIKAHLNATDQTSIFLGGTRKLNYPKAPKWDR